MGSIIDIVRHCLHNCQSNYDARIYNIARRIDNSIDWPDSLGQWYNYEDFSDAHIWRWENSVSWLYHKNTYFVTSLPWPRLSFIFELRTNATWVENSEEIINDGISFGILFTVILLIQMLTKTFAIDCLNWAALRQITRIRIKYFESLMRQEIGWYDLYGDDNNFAVRNTEWENNKCFCEFICNFNLNIFNRSSEISKRFAMAFLRKWASFCYNWWAFSFL